MIRGVRFAPRLTHLLVGAGVLIAATAMGVFAWGTPGWAEPDPAEIRDRDRAGLATLAARLGTVPPAERAALFRRADLGPDVLLVGPGSGVDAAAGVALPAAVPLGGWSVRAGRGVGEVRLTAVPIPGEPAGAGLLRVGRGTGADPAGRSGRIAFLVVLGGLAIVFTGVFGAALAREIRRVERSLVRVTVALGEDDPPPSDSAGRDRPDAGAGDELGLLSRRIDELGDYFAERFEEVRRRRRELHAGRRTRIDFLELMSHELRTPLNSILGFAEVLVEGLDGDLSPAQRENLRIVRESGENLLSLIDDILDLSALQAGTVRPQFEEVDLGEIARSVLDEAEGQLRGKRIRLAADLPDAPLTARADRRMVRRILQNLVGNGLKFTVEGEIRIAGRRREDGVEIEVSDTGAGIDPESLAAIFEEYTQAGDRRTRRQGTGLGLALSRRFARIHGGDLSARSTVGAGSVFTLRLPDRPSQAPEDGRG